MLARLAQLAPVRTAIANIGQPVRLLLYRKARLSAARIGGGGRLSIGKYWPGQVPHAAEVTVRPGGAMTVTGNFVLHRGVRLRVGPTGRLTLGSGYLADDVQIDCHCAITIGDRVAIAARTVIMDTDHHHLSGARAREAPVVIGDDVWIGIGVIIVKGVTIGSGAVVAAGSVVVKDVPPRTLVAGNPARAIREVEWTL